MIVASYKAMDTFDAIVDVTIRAGLLSVSPHFDLIAVPCERDLAAYRRGRLLSASIIGAQRPEDVMKPDYSCFESEVFAVMPAHSLHVQLLPTVPVFRVRRVSIFFFQRSDIRSILEVTGIYARAGSVKISLDSGRARRLNRLNVDQRVVANDDGFVDLDKPDAAHVSRQSVHLVDTAHRLNAVFPLSEIQDLELAGRRTFILGLFDVNSSNPIVATGKIFDQMMPDEPSGTRDEHSCLRH